MIKNEKNFFFNINIKFNINQFDIDLEKSSLQVLGKTEFNVDFGYDLSFGFRIHVCLLQCTVATGSRVQRALVQVL